MKRTALILGDQLSSSNPVLDGAERVLFVESLGALRGRRYHRARVQLVWSAMRHRAHALREEGREVVEIREAPDFRTALDGGCGVDVGIEGLTCQRPESHGTARMLEALGVELVEGRDFLADPGEFAEWASGRKRITMEFFYRRMRSAHSLLIDSEGGPEGGKWNLDSENRRPPKAGISPPAAWRPEEDAIDAGVRADLERLEREQELEFWGDAAPRRFAVTPQEAQLALSDFVSNRLEGFGPWQDAMVPGEETMFHSLLSVPLNLGLLAPLDACRAVESAFRAGEVPLQSAEGFIRQVIGWREFVRCMYRFREGQWEGDNALSASRPLPAAFREPNATDWECLRATVDSVERTGYAHHIERLMVLGNAMLLIGVDPREGLAWFRESFVDAADWVMAPNAIGMALHADGGVTMTKPYAAGGNYMSRMSMHCGSCRYDPKRRTGEDACPLTALYWEFLDRNRELLGGNQRMSLSFRNLERIPDAEMEEIRLVADGARLRLGVT